MIAKPETVLVVIDAQRAFVDPAGSLTRAFGVAEVQPGIDAFHRLCRHLGTRAAVESAIFVRSEYSPGQFTGGRLDHPMAELCVPGRNVDCEWATGVAIAGGDHVVTKHHADACESAAFRAAIDRIVAAGARHIVLAGFQFTTCVAASALSTWQAVQGRGVSVAVLEHLTGARASSYLRDTSGPSRVEATRQRLGSAGIAVINDTAWGH
ncbi:MAG TPA: isochorismatase family protein [Vicinamibacterales bacterium]|nr:isochorismatase family protein [Vicinamibacterales bacterium]